MKKLVALCLLLVLSLPMAAVDGQQVKYVGGTVPGVNAGVIGKFDIISDTSLTFEHAGNKLMIPYASIESFDYSKEVARHLGVLPAIVVALLRIRQRRHFFRISYRGPTDVAQVAIFEVPKHMPRTLRAVLNARRPETDKSCKPCVSPNGRD